MVTQMLSHCKCQIITNVSTGCCGYPLTENLNNKLDPQSNIAKPNINKSDNFLLKTIVGITLGPSATGMRRSGMAPHPVIDYDYSPDRCFTM